MADCLLTRCADLARAVDRLKLISSHDALVLLKNSLSAPKLLHTLRSACCADDDDDDNNNNNNNNNNDNNNNNNNNKWQWLMWMVAAYQRNHSTSWLA